MKNIRKKRLFHRFLKETKGVAFVEFAILSPILVTLMLAGFDLVLFNNAKSTVQTVNSSIATTSNHLSTEYDKDLGEIAFGMKTNPQRWYRPNYSLYIYAETLYEFLRGLAIPLQICPLNQTCNNNRINIVYTVFFCPLNTSQSDYLEITYYFAGKNENLGSSEAYVREMLRTAKPELGQGSLDLTIKDWDQLECSSNAERNYLRVLTNYYFTSPFSKLLEGPINHVSMRRLSQKSADKYGKILLFGDDPNYDPNS